MSSEDNRPPPTRGGGRGGRGRGGRSRGGGRGRGPGRRGGGRGRHNNNRRHGRGGGRKHYNNNGSRDGISDEDVLIAFTPLLRSQNLEAVSIHKRYTDTDDEKTFLADARKLLESLSSQPTDTPNSPGNKEKKIGFSSSNTKSSTVEKVVAKDDDVNDELEKNESRTINNKSSSSDEKKDAKAGNTNKSNAKKDSGSSVNDMSISSSAAILPPPTIKEEITPTSNNATDANVVDKEAAPNKTMNNNGAKKEVNEEEISHGIQNIDVNSGNVNEKMKTETPVSTRRHPPGFVPPASSAVPNSNSSITNADNDTPKASTAGKGALDDETEKEHDKDKKDKEAPAPFQYQPKRLVRNQPGAIYANGTRAPNTVYLRPRQELQAQWSIPLLHLLTLAKPLTKTHPPTSPTLRDVITSLNLTIGLFRRGTLENWNAHNNTNTSIISKAVGTAFQLQTTPSTTNNKNNPKESYVFGNISFYSPKTPGNITFRLYMQDKPIQTLATGPLMVVYVPTPDLDPTLRFVLSTFRRKKDAGGSGLGAMQSLIGILSNWRVESNSQGNHAGNGHHNQYESAGRATWGCICESQKVLEGAKVDHDKKMEKNEKVIDGLHGKIADLDTQEAQEESDDVEDEEVADINKDIVDVNSIAPVQDDKVQDSTEQQEKESKQIEIANKKKALLKKLGAAMKEKAMVERKWRDVQAAYAAILQAITTNATSMNVLLRRDQLLKLRLEHELWCPLCETFASTPPNVQFTNNSTPKDQEEWRKIYQKQKQLMQKEKLGFVPADNIHVETLLHAAKHEQVKTIPGATPTKQPPTRGSMVLQSLSISMANLYHTELSPGADFYATRERVRQHLEHIVNTQCQSHFPLGTRVIVFGSSANGFGGNKSDLDMCLQLPPMRQPPPRNNSSNDSNTGANDQEQKNIWFEDGGRAAMATLAEKLESNGMQSVDTNRLSARIPVVMFHYPIPSKAAAGNDKQEGASDATDNDIPSSPTLECDISMQNPLAVLNTQLLRSFSMLDNRVPILVSIIKQWAKGRNINDPSRHTLSSYGYILMLLHFLLQLPPNSHNNTRSNQRSQQDSHNKKNHGECMFLPNLLWMDPHWKPGQPYKETPERPTRNLLSHPTEANYHVNPYFYQPKDEETLQALQSLVQKPVPTTTASIIHEVAIILSKFFRYYAFEFDYKKHVISLHSSPRRGLLDKEVKAEIDGWKLGNNISIEDPFEIFYDVAHVVKPTQFSRIRREFALAYTKIVRVCQGVGNRGTSEMEGVKKVQSGEDLIRFLCEGDLLED